MTRAADLAPAGRGARCVVHPARPAADACPVCGRPRCAADADALGTAGCPVCAAPAASATRPATTVERLVRAALGALAVALAGGAVSAEYVGSPVFGVVTPAVLGAGCGAAAQAAAAGPRRGPAATRVRAVAAVLSVLGVGLGVLVEGSSAPVSTSTAVPAVIAVAGALLWTVPPRQRAAPGVSPPAGPPG